MMMCCFLAECISVASKRDTHTHTQRERERNVLLCVRKSALLFPDQKIGLFSRFFCTSTEEEEGKERETKERRGILSLQTHLSVLLCAPILLLRRPEEKSVGVVKGAAAIVGEEGRKRKRRRRRLWRKRRTQQWGKEGKEEKGGRGYLATRTSQKKKRETHLFPKTLLTRDAHTTRRRHAHNETTRRERERERERERDVVVVVVWLHNGDEKPKDDDDFENTRSKV